MPDYPTEQQIEECFEAYKKGGDALREYLKKAEAERQRELLDGKPTQ